MQTTSAEHDYSIFFSGRQRFPRSGVSLEQPALKNQPFRGCNLIGNAIRPRSLVHLFGKPYASVEPQRHEGTNHFQSECHERSFLPTGNEPYKARCHLVCPCAPFRVLRVRRSYSDSNPKPREEPG